MLTIPALLVASTPGSPAPALPFSLPLLLPLLAADGEAGEDDVDELGEDDFDELDEEPDG